MNGLYDELAAHHEASDGDGLRIDFILNASSHTLLAFELNLTTPIPVQVSTADIRGLTSTVPERRIDALLIGHDSPNDIPFGERVSQYHCTTCPSFIYTGPMGRISYTLTTGETGDQSSTKQRRRCLEGKKSPRFLDEGPLPL